MDFDESTDLVAQNFKYSPTFTKKSAFPKAFNSLVSCRYCHRLGQTISNCFALPHDQNARASELSSVCGISEGRVFWPTCVFGFLSDAYTYRRSYTEASVRFQKFSVC